MAAVCCGAQRSVDSVNIDYQLKKEAANEKHNIRVLVLGTSASGTTLNIFSEAAQTKNMATSTVPSLSPAVFPGLHKISTSLLLLFRIHNMQVTFLYLFFRAGKSTVAKQMRILHCNGFTGEELENYKQILILNIFNGMKELVIQAEGLNIKVTRKNKKVAAYFVEVNPYTEKLDAETVGKAKQLWADSGTFLEFYT